MNQTTIFDMMYPKYKITKPIRLIELFSGYGSQALALKYLDVPFEHWKTCEWAIKSIQAYKDIHFQGDHIDYCENMNKTDLVEHLYRVGISSNYNEPMSKEQIARLNEKQLKTIFNNIVATSDMVNIQRVTANELDIVDTDKYEYIMTYSFPCQDLSLAGKKKGMSDTSTRSGMLWEVERVLTECYELKSMPQILLMENVPQVHSLDNMPDFHKWQVRLEELGYKSYWQDLIATDYGIPQTRNRCFMISILGDYSYTFPKPIPLKLKLKDMLEEYVDEKYYLSDKMIKYISAGNEKWTGNNNEALINKTCASTLNTNEGSRRCDASNYISDNVGENYNLKIKNATKQDYLETVESDNFIKVKKNTENYIEWEEKGKIQMNCRAWKDDKIVATLNTGGETKILIKNATKQGYLEATDGDGIDISSRMEYHRGTVQKGMTQTITTMGGENNGVVVSDTLKKDLCNKLIKEGLVEEGDVVKHSYTQQILEGNKKCVEKNDGNMITLTTRGDCVGVCVGTYQYAKSDNFMCGRDRLQLGKEVSDTLQTTQKEGIVNSDLRIRKLTPRECFRLMGVKDEDFDKVSKNQSDNSLYHLAGDSICTSCLMALFSQLLDISWEDKLWNIKNSIKMENT